jgi:hypothetical protein
MVEEISTCKENKKALSDVMKDPEGMLSHIDAISPTYHDAERHHTNLQNVGEQDGYVFHLKPLVNGRLMKPPNRETDFCLCFVTVEEYKDAWQRKCVRPSTQIHFMAPNVIKKGILWVLNMKWS